MSGVLRQLRILPATLAWLAAERLAFDRLVQEWLLAPATSVAPRRAVLEAALDGAAARLSTISPAEVEADFALLGRMTCVFPYQTEALRALLAEVGQAFREAFARHADRPSLLALLPAGARLHLLLSLLTAFADNFHRHFALPPKNP